MLPNTIACTLTAVPKRIGNAIDATIVNRATAHPGIEDRGNRHAQLFVWIFGNGVLLGENDLLFGGDDFAQLFGFQIRIASTLCLRFEAIHHAFELFVRDAHHDFAEQRSEATVGIERKAQVTGLLGQPLNRLFIETEVQNRIHHSGHRKRRAGSHRDQQRVLRIAELLADLLFDLLQRLPSTCSHMPSGNALSLSKKALQASVVTIRPGGTGSPARVISQRPAPLPPNRDLSSPGLLRKGKPTLCLLFDDF